MALQCLRGGRRIGKGHLQPERRHTVDVDHVAIGSQLVPSCEGSSPNRNGFTKMELVTDSHHQ